MSTETPKSELKPCPFCGSPAGKVEHHITPQHRPDGSVYESRSVQCSRIFKGCMGAGPIKGSEAEAIEAWNARATDAELSRVREERDTALRRIKERGDEIERLRVEKCAAQGEAERERQARLKMHDEMERQACLATEARMDRDAALRRVEELEGLATGNECHAAGGTWFEVFVSDDRLGGTETEGDECPTLGKVFPARLDAAEKGKK